MKVLLFDHPQDVSQEELANDMLFLPPWRKEKVWSFHFLLDRVLCAKAYLLLKQGLKEAYGIDCNPEFEYVAHDKPVLKDYPHIHFNLSHCKRGVICVIDDHPVGCDIEEIEEKLDTPLCHFCYNDEEVNGITSSLDPCVAFTRLWTMKEAVLKLTGEGINDNLPSLFSTGLLDRVVFDTHIEKEKGFVYSICSYADK